MTFIDVLDQARALLRSKGRISHRALKRQFDLDDEYLEDIKVELVDSERVASDEDDKILVWIGEGNETENRGNGEAASRVRPPTPIPQTLASYTPQRLAARIRAEQQAMESRGASDGERKTITALFADLKGSTALIEGLDPEDARATIEPARFYEAELYRLKGELTLKKSQVESDRSRIEEEAEECFQQAIEIAQNQQAKSLELRAATSLACLWQRQEKTAEACDLLAPVFNWFTEGFDTADLKDAKAVLDELSEAV